MENKIFYFDVETTGLYASKHDIVQFAAIIEIDGVIKETVNLRMKPTNFETISQKALDVTGLTLEDLKSYPDSHEVFDELVEVLDKYIDRFNKLDKFQIVGQNVQFDVKFFEALFKKNENNYYGSYFSRYTADPYELFKFMKSHGIVNYANLRLGTICDKLKIPIDAHDALSDVTATRELYSRLGRYLKSGTLTHLTKPVSLEHPDTTGDMFDGEK